MDPLGAKSADEPKDKLDKFHDTKSKTRAFPVVLCSCPQKCSERVPQDVRQVLNTRFYELTDNVKQNEYLQTYIEMRSVYKRLWSEEERIGGRLQRRVSCKYKIPLDTKNHTIDAFRITKKPTIHTNSKGKITYVVNIKEGVKTIEVCQKAFMNVYGITEKRIRLQREKLIARLRTTALETMESPSIVHSPKKNAIDNSSRDDQEWSPKVAVLEAFFGNQLWRPEYIGMSPEINEQSFHMLHKESI